MPRDVNSYLAAQQAKCMTEDAQDWAMLEDLYNKKLWHQLTVKLLEFVKSPQMQEGDALVQLYENFIAEFENKMNPLSTIEIVVHINKQIKDAEKRLEFIGKMKEKVKGCNEAVILCNILSGQIKLTREDLDGVKKLIQETEEMTEALDGVTTVHGRFYQLCSDYHQVVGNHASYYRDALRYLGCTQLEDIPEAEQASRAFTLCLAAILGEGVYNFGELLAHPVLDCLKDTDKYWVVEVLYAFNSGSLERYEELRPHWQAQPDLAARELSLRQKITLLCLMEMAFRRPGNHRVLSFEEISKEARLPEKEVELLIMKALSLGLVKGSIDQVDGKVQMTWVQPRVLDKNQIGHMKVRLEQWCHDVHTMVNLLENKACDILT